MRYRSNLAQLGATWLKMAKTTILAKDLHSFLLHCNCNKPSWLSGIVLV